MKLPPYSLLALFLVPAISFLSASEPSPAASRVSAPLLRFLANAGIEAAKNAPSTSGASVTLTTAKQDFQQMTFDVSCFTLTPLKIGKEGFAKGLGMHANGNAVYKIAAPFERFTAQVGVDVNSDTQGKLGSVEFIVKVDGKEVARTPIVHSGEPAQTIDVPVAGAKQLELIVTDGGDGNTHDQADWAEARLLDKDGKATYLNGRTANSKFLQQDHLPSSFVYGGEPSSELLKTWPREEKPAVEQADRSIYETTWREPGGGLAASWKVEVFHDQPAMEFRWIFVNEGKAPAKPLTQVNALDLDTAVICGPNVRAIHSTGGTPYEVSTPSAGFGISESILGNLTISGFAGRSSDRDLPFFVVHSSQPAEGIFVGVGWSGQWEAKLNPVAPKQLLHITTQMPGMNLALPPGERIVSPSILLGTYSGDWTTGANTLRRMLYEKYVPLLAGAKPQPPVSWSSWFMFDNKISEEMLKAQADGAAAAGVEYFCIDAGWFEGAFPNGVGNWTLDRTKFPQGLGPIGAYVEKRGMKLGLWFEPERAAAGTRIVREHPEWVHGDLVDFGNPAAREWMFGMMKQFIDEGHVRWIRWDFNTSPLNAWNGADAADQRGLTQIRHIMGLYDFLDRLMKAYPDLLIEGCASGGRRIDLETVRRSHTFWKSDETGNIPLLRFHEAGGNIFLPAVLLNINILPERMPFDMISVFGDTMGFRSDWSKVDSQQSQRIRNQVDIYKQIRGLLNEDYFALTPQQRVESGWDTWQFNSPSRGEGVVIALRPEKSPYSTAHLSLKGLDPDSAYTIAPLEGAPEQPQQLTGKQLSDGFTLDLNKPATGAVIRYSTPKRH